MHRNPNPSKVLDKSRFARRPRRIILILLLLGIIALPLGFAGSQAWAEYQFCKAKDKIKARDFTTARELLDQSLWFRPNNLEVLYLAARTARRDRDYKKAKELLKVYRAKGGIPEAIELEELLALAQSGQVASVEKKLWPFVFENHEEAPFVLEALAQGYIHTSHWAAATECLKRLVGYWPEDYAVHVMQGWVSESLHDLAAAEKEYRHALDLRPDQDDSRLRLVEVLVQEQQYEPAVTELEYLRKKLPDDEKVTLLIAKCYAERNRLDEAEGLLISLLEKKPKDTAPLLKEMGNVAIKQARWQDAEKWLRKCLEQAPRDLRANLSLQQCLRHLGKDDEAEKMQSLVDDLNKDQKRLEQLKSEMMTAKDSLPIRIEASRILLRIDQEADGVKLLESVLQEDPTNSEACSLLADHFQGKGDKALAEVYRRRAKETRSGANGSGNR